nr:MAG TPA: hypothetical protein [Caudoviricetes sp.]
MSSPSVSISAIAAISFLSCSNAVSGRLALWAGTFLGRLSLIAAISFVIV